MSGSARSSPAAAEPLDGAAADHVLEGRPVAQRRQQLERRAACASARAPRPPPPRRSSWRPRAEASSPSAPAAVSSPTEARPAPPATARRTRGWASPSAATSASRASCAPGGAERAGGGRAHRPEGVLRQRGGERRDPRRIGQLAERARRRHPVHRPAAPAPSWRRQSGRLLSSRIDFRTTSPGSKITWVGRAGRRELERVRGLGDRDPLVAARRPSTSKRTSTANLNSGASA